MEERAVYHTRANTSLAISHEFSRELDRFCTGKGYGKKQFVEHALNFFRANGIDPANFESPDASIKKLQKRIDASIEVYKAQERDLLRPILLKQEELKEDTRKTKTIWSEYLITTKETFQNIEKEIKRLQDNNEKQSKSIEALIKVSQSQSQTIEQLTKIIEEKLSKKIF